LKIVDEEYQRMLNSLHKNVNIVTFIKFQRFRRIEYLQQMDKVRNSKKIQQTNLQIKRTKGGARWKDNVQNIIRKMNILKWRQAAQKKRGWRRASRETIVLPGW
jgi:hypothetical protein